MKKPLLTNEQLLSLGFTFLGDFPLENGDYYKWWMIKKNDSQLDITYEYLSDSEIRCACIDFNAEALLGKELDFNDIKFLIEIM